MQKREGERDFPFYPVLLSSAARCLTSLLAARGDLSGSPGAVLPPPPAAAPGLNARGRQHRPHAVQRRPPEGSALSLCVWRCHSTPLSNRCCLMHSSLYVCIDADIDVQTYKHTYIYVDSSVCA